MVKIIKKKIGKIPRKIINEKGILIKNLLTKGFTPKQITRKWGYSKQLISYWKYAEIKVERHRKKKLNEDEINEVIKMAEDQSTSIMSSRAIAAAMNVKFKERGQNKTIGKTTICDYLKEYRRKQRQIKKVFGLNEKQKKRKKMNK